MPKSGNALSAGFGRMSCAPSVRASRQLPGPAKGIILVYPHTSNWDFPLGLARKVALSLDAAFLGKHTIFRFPFGIYLRWLVYPVNRKRRGVRDGDPALSLERQALRRDRARGTRRRSRAGRAASTGSHGRANVPVVPVLFDWSRRWFASIRRSNGQDLEADVARCSHGPPPDGAPPRAVLGP